MIRVTCRLLVLLALLGLPLVASAEESPAADRPADVVPLTEPISSRPGCVEKDSTLADSLFAPEDPQFTPEDPLFTPEPTAKCTQCQGPFFFCPDDHQYGTGTCVDGCCVYCIPCPCSVGYFCSGECCLPI